MKKSMEEEKKLYPMHFEPVEALHPWGKERFLIADLGRYDTAAKDGWLEGDSLSDIMETYIDRMVGDNVYYYYGRQFPVAVRALRAEERMPLTVCPDDALAGERFDALGKAKLWYIAGAEPGSRLYLGLNRSMTAAEFYNRSLDGSLAECLHAVTPKRGDWYYIAPGTVHAAANGLDIIEISEASMLDVTVFGWGADADPEDLGLGDALDFIDLKAYVAPAAPQENHTHADIRPEDRLADKLADTEAFQVTRIRLTDPLHLYTEQFGSFLLYACAEGEASLQVPRAGGMDSYLLKKGEVLLVPAETPDFFLVPRDRDTVLLETAVRPSSAPDSYIDPAAEPYLEGEDYSVDEDLDDRIDYELSHPES